MLELEPHTSFVGVAEVVLHWPVLVDYSLHQEHFDEPVLEEVFREQGGLFFSAGLEL